MISLNLESIDIEVKCITNNPNDIIKTRYIDRKTKTQILRVDHEESINPYKFKESLEFFDVIVISDYDKGFVSSPTITEIVDNAIIPVFIDSKKTTLPEYNCFIKINKSEYDKLENTIDNNVIMTLGCGGAEYNNKIYPGENVMVYDVIGAGDDLFIVVPSPN